MKQFLSLAVFLCCAGLVSRAAAHEVRPAYLELRQTAADSYDVLWKVPALGDRRLGIYVRFPDDATSLDEPRGYFRDKAYIERSSVQREGGLEGQTVHIDGLSGTNVDVLVRIERLDGATQTTRVMPTLPTFVVEAVPSGWNVFRTYLVIGVEHILLGVDHLLFVLGLLLIVQSRMMLLKTITAFTVAHSLTLGIATLGYATLPLPPLNAAIALSILFLGPEIVRVWRGESSFTIRHPWVVAFAFGLLHGFGFASGLSITGISPSAIPQALLYFNIGVELGQLAFVGLVFALLRSFQTLEMRWPLWAARGPGYVVGVAGAFWTIQRTIILLSMR